MTKKQKILQRIKETQASRENVITIRSIAQEFGVSRTYIYEIIKHETNRENY